MSVVTDKIFKSRGYGRGREVSIGRDDKDFVVAFQPEDHVIFRHHDLNALKKVCRKLQWKIIADKSFPDNLADVRAYLTGIG
jgi:predicted nucleic acid-binding OB-fold protein